jgi:hypothetical protein
MITFYTHSSKDNNLKIINYRRFNVFYRLNRPVENTWIS